MKYGNAAQAAREAGYSEKAARQTGSRLLTHDDISAYIKELLAGETKSRIASALEAMEFYTSVMRGEIRDAFGLDLSMSERLKAADQIIKRHTATQRGGDTMARLDALLSEMRKAAENQTI